jgi:hypothetical protein
MKIGYSKKVTKNLGNYESLVIKINVEEDLQDGQSHDELFYKLKDFVNAKIEEDFSSHISSQNQKKSIAEIKTSFDKTDAKSDDSDSIKQVLRNLCLNKVQQDANNRFKINSLLSEFKVSKVLDLHNDDLSSFKNKLEAL